MPPQAKDEGISPTMTKLDAWLDQHHAAFTAIRRDIHEHPELGLEEVRTAKLVADKLREWVSRSPRMSARPASSA